MENNDFGFIPEELRSETDKIFIVLNNHSDVSYLRLIKSTNHDTEILPTGLKQHAKMPLRCTNLHVNWS